MDQLRTGSVLAGRYRLAGLADARTLSPGSVWRAVDEVTRLEIAVKVVDARHAGDPTSWTTACRVLTTLRCPGVAQVHDDGLAAAPGGAPIRYLVRDLVPGQTLEERLAEGPLQAAEALRIVASLAGTLAALHQLGLSHGNLVPSNVVLGPDGVIVTDAGLWLLRDHPVVEVFPSALSYIAPERAAGGPVTPAADMYALGVVFVACLAGIAAGGNAGIAPATSMLGQALARSPIWGEQLADERPADEQPAGDPASLLASCLGADPGDRPSAARAAAVTRQIAARSVPGPAGLAGPAGRRAGATRASGRVRARRAGTLAVAGAATGLFVAVAGLAAAVVVATTRPQTPRPAVSTPSVSAHVAVPSSTNTGTTPRQNASASAASSTSAPVRPGAPSRLTSIDQLWRTVVQGGSDGQIRPDVATDMLNLIGPVRASLVAGRPAGVAGLVVTLRNKLATRLAEGAITPAAASTIRAELDRLAASR